MTKEQAKEILWNRCQHTPETAEAIRVLSEERPKLTGEWLWLGDNPNSNHKWSCNKCGRGVKEQENFCPNCGAQMIGGGANE